MKVYVQVNKDSKRVLGYGSMQSKNDFNLEIEIENTDKKFEELLKNPLIFKFNEINNDFIKDSDYQEKLIFEKENRLTDNEKITRLTKQLAKTKVDNMQKETMISMLIREQAKAKIEKMKVGV